MSLSLIDQDGSSAIDLDQKMFAQLDLTIFKKTPIDTLDMVQKIKTLGDYKSIKEIIENQEEVPDQ